MAPTFANALDASALSGSLMHDRHDWSANLMIYDPIGRSLGIHLRCIHGLIAPLGYAELKLDFGSTPDLAAPFLKKAILASLQFLFLLVTRLTYICNFAPGMSSLAAITSLDPAEVEHVIDQIGEAQTPSAICLQLVKPVQNCHNLFLV